MFILRSVSGLVLTFLCVHSYSFSKQPIFFDIPPMPIEQGLIEFALQSKYQLVLQRDNEQADNRRSGFLYGFHYLDEALVKMIKNLDLEYEFSDVDNLIIIRDVGGSPKPTENLDDPEPSKESFSEIVVIGRNIAERYSSVFQTTFRNGVSVFDSARYHNILSENILDDLVGLEMESAYRSYPGVLPLYRLQGSNDDYSIRGYKRQNLYYDGFRLSDETAFKVVKENVSSVDLLKGPSMLFYGQSSPGGILNITPKHPGSKKIKEIKVKTNSSESHSLSWLASDSNIATTPASFFFSIYNYDSGLAFEASRTGYRVGLGYQGEKLALRVENEFQLTGQYFDIEKYLIKNYDNQHPLLMTAFNPHREEEFSANVHLFSVSSNYQISDRWSTHVQLASQMEHRSGYRLDDRVLKESNLFGTKSRGRNAGIDVMSVLTTSVIEKYYQGRKHAGFGAIYSIVDRSDQDYSASISAYVSGSFDAFGVSNRLTFGGDYYTQDMNSEFLVQARVLPLDLSILKIGEDYREALLDRAARLPSGYLRAFEVQYPAVIKQRQDSGLYFQIHSDLSDTLSASIGTRYSMFSGDHTSSSLESLNTDIADISRQLGLTYRPSGNMTIFSNLSEAISLRYLVDELGEHIKDPEKSEQVELGARWINVDWKSELSVAAFSITSENNYAMSFEGGFWRLSSPLEHVSQGIETTLSSSIGGKLDVSVSLSSNRNTHKERNLKQDADSSNTHSANLLTRYTLRDNLDFVINYYWLAREYLSSNVSNPQLMSTNFDASLEKAYGGAKVKISACNLLGSRSLVSLNELRVQNGFGRSLYLELKLEL